MSKMTWTCHTLHPESWVCKRFPAGFVFLVIIAELRRPEGPPSGAPYPYRKLKETHELIFSWLSWLAVLLVGAYA